MSNALLEPLEIEVETAKGEMKNFILSKFPAIAGREIVSQYPVTGMPKIGEYKSNEDIMLKLMKFVAVPTDTGVIVLSTQALINNHVPDWETLAKIEIKMMEYNCSFFGNGKASTFFGSILQNTQQLITQTLTDLLVQSSAQGKPHSESLKKNTRSKKPATSTK
jgi:hypothetical protein